MNKKPIFIAEIGINHHGNMEKAFRMIDSAKMCGADFVKFQYYNPAKVLGRKHPAYQYATQCFLSKEQHETLRVYCYSVGIHYLVSVFDVKDVHWANTLCTAHKIATRMNTNQEFIAAIAKTNKPVFMSVSPDIKVKKNYLEKFQLMWCIPGKYPSDIDEILAYPYEGFGLSSHCPDPRASLEAYYKGCRLFENHLCESKTELGCDISSSLDFNEYRALIKACR